MTGDALNKKLSGALRAQACGLAAEGPAGASLGPPRPSPAAPRTSAWMVLALAVALGTVAGGLAGVISTW